MNKLFLVLLAAGVLSVSASASPISCGTVSFTGGVGTNTVTCSGQAVPSGFQVVGYSLTYFADLALGFGNPSTVSMLFTPVTATGFNGWAPVNSTLTPTCAGGTPSSPCSTGAPQSGSASASAISPFA